MENKNNKQTQELKENVVSSDYKTYNTPASAEYRNALAAELINLGKQSHSKAREKLSYLKHGDGRYFNTLEDKDKSREYFEHRRVHQCLIKGEKVLPYDLTKLYVRKSEGGRSYYSGLEINPGFKFPQDLSGKIDLLLELCKIREIGYSSYAIEGDRRHQFLDSNWSHHSWKVIDKLFEKQSISGSDWFGTLPFIEKSMDGEGCLNHYFYESDLYALAKGGLEAAMKSKKLREQKNEIINRSSDLGRKLSDTEKSFLLDYIERKDELLSNLTGNWNKNHGGKKYWNSVAYVPFEAPRIVKEKINFENSKVGIVVNEQIAGNESGYTETKSASYIFDGKKFKLVKEGKMSSPGFPEPSEACTDKRDVYEDYPKARGKQVSLPNV